MNEPVLKDVFRHLDDRGVLTQTFGDDFVPKRCYEIKDRAGIIRAWHGHKEESKLVYVSKGVVKFILVPIDGIRNIVRSHKVFVLSSDKPQTLLIPSGHYNGFKSLTNSTIHFYSDKTLEESKADDVRGSGSMDLFDTITR